jgi:hypothetical protein
VGGGGDEKKSQDLTAVDVDGQTVASSNPDVKNHGRIKNRDVVWYLLFVYT